jgi:hypothetical protein
LWICEGLIVSIVVAMLSQPNGWKCHVNETHSTPEYGEIWLEVLRLLELLKRSHDVQLRERKKLKLEDLELTNMENNLISDENNNTPVSIFVELADVRMREGNGKQRVENSNYGKRHHSGDLKDLGNTVGEKMTNDCKRNVESEGDYEENKDFVHIKFQRAKRLHISKDCDQEEHKNNVNVGFVHHNEGLRQGTLVKDLKNLKQVLRVERRENVALRAQNVALEAKIVNMLASMQSK